MKRTLTLIVLLITVFNGFAGKSTVVHEPTFAKKDIYQSQHFQKNVPGLINDYNGQPIRYFVDCNGMTAFLTDGGPVYKTIKINDKERKVLDKERAEKLKGEKEEKEEVGGRKIHLEVNYVFEKWIGANPHPIIEEVQGVSGHYTYMAGSNEKEYHTIQTTACSKLIYHDVYPGIDVVFTLPEKGGMIYDFIVHPGADPSLIQIDYEGPVRTLALDHSGNMIIHAANGDIMEHTPASYLENGVSVASSYKVDGHHVSFSLPNYDHRQTLTIDPWVSVLTQFTVRNLGADVDYDVAGNLYVYGAGSANFIDITNYQKVAKYDPNGNLLWVFNCNLPTINWSSALDSASLGVADNPLSNAKIDRLTGKVYVGKGFDPFYGTQVVRLDTSGNYDNFVSARNSLFLEIWSFVQNCSTGDIVAMGGGTNSNLNLTDINHTTGIASTNNFTGVAYGGVQLGQGSCQDIVSGALDSAQSLYVVLASNSTNSVNNKIYKVNSAYTGTIWGPVGTGYTSFSEANNLPDFDAVNGSSNNFNALAVNSQYLYCYDGNHVSAFNTSTGAAVGTNLVINTARRAKVLLYGGIAVDRCNNIYLGGKGEILVYSFNGTTYTAGTPISLGAAYANDSVFDVRYNPINNLLYATGTQFVGTFTPTPLVVCTQPLPFSDTIYAVNASSGPCTLPEAIVHVTPDATFVNGIFTYVWQDTLGNILVTHGPDTAQSDTFHPTVVGTYVVNIEYTENCGLGSHLMSIVITGSDSLGVSPGPDTTICQGQSVVLNAIPCSAGGGSYHWSPGGATTASITVSPTTTTTYSVTYTPLTGTGPITDTIQVRVTGVVTMTVNDTTICNGQSATLTASPSIPGGTYSWSPGSATTPAITVTPAPNSSNSYTVTYTTQHCGTATATGTVTSGPNAGPDQYVTCYPLHTAATMAATGTGTWTALPSNPGTPTITNPSSPTTTITGFSVLGVYTFIWTNGSCTDTALVTVSATASAGPDQTVSCAILPGGSATMAAGGVGLWSPLNNNPGTSSIGNVSNPTTTISGFSAAGTYNYIWTSGGCSDTAAVIVTAKPNAGPDQTVSCVILPGGSATMAGTGTGVWTADPGNTGTATITTPTSPTTTISGFSIAGTYNFIWTNGTCVDTATVTVTAKPNAGADATICVNGTATLSATGTGTWTAQANNPGAATITSPASATTTITGMASAGTYGFVWTSGGCTDTADVIVNAAPTLNPTVTNITCANATGVIYANASGASPLSYQWSTTATADSITTTTPGVYYTVTVTDHNQCTATSGDSVRNLIVTVGLTDSLQDVSCYGYSDGHIILYVTPAGTYTYAWSNGDHTDTITGLSPGNNYMVTVTDPNGCSTVGGPYTITMPTGDSLSIVPLDSTMTLGDTIHLYSTVTGAYPALTYSWTPDTGLSCNNCPNPMLIPNDYDTVITWYKLSVTYNNGCLVTDSASILAKPNDLIGIPDAFTPNGDNMNPEFKILATSVKSFRMTIYDRWGQQVFAANDITQGWDGTFKGTPQPTGMYTYFFSLTYINGKVVNKEGTLSLFR